MAIARRRALSGSLPMMRSSASRSAGEAELGLIQEASSSSRMVTRLLPIASSCAVPSKGQRWFSCGFDWLKMASKMAPSAAACATALATRLLAIRISVRPLAVRCATMKAISTSVHSTIISAKPPLRRQAVSDGGCLGTDLQTVRVGYARNALALQLLRDEPRVDQLDAKVLG